MTTRRPHAGPNPDGQTRETGSEAPHSSPPATSTPRVSRLAIPAPLIVTSRDLCWPQRSAEPRQSEAGKGKAAGTCRPPCCKRGGRPLQILQAASGSRGGATARHPASPSREAVKDFITETKWPWANMPASASLAARLCIGSSLISVYYKDPSRRRVYSRFCEVPKPTALSQLSVGRQTEPPPAVPPFPTHPYEIRSI